MREGIIVETHGVVTICKHASWHTKALLHEIEYNLTKHLG